LNGAGKNFPLEMKDGFCVKDGVRMAHSMCKVLPSGARVEKGLKAVLLERGLWVHGLPIADAKALLQCQPDFLEQGSWLEQVVQARGYAIDFTPSIIVS
jgi:hypothetical protein